MDTVKSLEKQLVDINKDLPKLPNGLTKWLADYSWLLVLIGIALSVMALISLVPLLMVAFGISTLVGAGTLFSGYGFNPLIGSVAWLSATLSLINLLVVIVLEGAAVTPLKSKLYRGWQLIFMASLVSFAFSVITSIITVAFTSLVISAMFYALGLYVLFQLRPYFLPGKAKASAPKSAATPTAKK